jgi:hypothetical protein
MDKLRDIIARAIERGNTPRHGLTWGDCAVRADEVIADLKAAGFLSHDKKELSRPFSETVRERAERDPDFCEALREEGLNVPVSGMRRDVAN